MDEQSKDINSIDSVEIIDTDTQTQDNNSLDEEKAETSDYKKTSVLKNGFINTVYQILVIIIPLITTPYVSRVLDPSGIGIYSYTHSLVTYFVLFAGLGTIGYGTREISRKRQNKKDYSKTFFEIELLTIFTSLVSLGIWIVLALMYSEYRIYLLICSFYIVATLFDISWFYVGLEKIQNTVLINSIFKILSVICIFVFVKSEEDVFNYVMINAVALAAGNASMWVFLPKYLVKSKIDFSGLKYHFKETLVYFIPTIATSIYTVLDKTLIGVICNDDALNGYYEQGTKIANMGKAISFASIVGVVSPRMSFLYKIGRKDEINELKNNTLNIIMFIAIAVTIGVISIADVFVPMFYGDGYDKVIYVLYMMMPLCVIIAVSNILGGLYYTPIGKRKQSAIYLIIGSLFNLILNVILIPFLNIYGAIVATLIAEIIISMLYFVRCNGFITLKELIASMWKKLIAGIVMGLSILFLKELNYDIFSKEIYNLLFENIILIFSGGIIYLIVCLVLRDRVISLAIEKIKGKFKS